jgi:hypothetical protein
MLGHGRIRRIEIVLDIEVENQLLGHDEVAIFLDDQGVGHDATAKRVCEVEVEPE